MTNGRKLILQNPNISKIPVTANLIDQVTNASYFLKPIEQWEIYEVTNRPGLLFIQNPFTTHGQRYWTIRSLKEYSQKPNKSNIDNLNLLNENEQWWSVLTNPSTDVIRKKKLTKKMRWVTLGYHHNWDTKEYDFDNKNNFPDDLFNLCNHIASTLSLSDDYQAEAAIINFYREGDTLSGHTDHSEPYKMAPLISLSFGQSCIFLLGGTTKETKPTAIRINSGDICILSEQARLCYHAVPLILKSDDKPWLEKDEDAVQISAEDLFANKIDVDTYQKLLDDTFFKPFEQYLNECRINLNVRQVLHKKV
ncbi:nucleic acid dioxygenase ALKBH1-like [Ctenocephalides felis]|uniref:nucleic acid dioxygenase ALKBH1-like n=1 Tax=Ctenocephalides felis TaxID=7515 RepID=UPI000E6E11C0|nr:nucleic acid dioxygenase ALKBH1-like [Ctenocephalides felis]